jgi:hypothetical protein
MATPPDFTAGQVLTAAQMNAVGLWKITPSSATNGTISGNGTVSVTSASATVTVNGVFSSDYNAYLIVVSEWVHSTQAELAICMGTTFTGTAHRFSTIFVTTGGTITGGGNAGTDRIPVGIHSSTTEYGGGTITVVNPFIAQETSISAQNADVRAAGAPLRCSAGGVINNTSYTAFSLTAGGTITGMKIDVYGYN